MKKTTKRLLFPIFMATIIFTAACSAKTDTDNKKAPASGATKSDTQQKTQEKDSDNIKLKTLSGYEMDSKSLFTQSDYRYKCVEFFLHLLRKRNGDTGVG